MNRPASKTVRRRFFVALGHAIHVTWPILSIILATQVVMGLLVGIVEGWSVGDAVYFSFVTGLSNSEALRTNLPASPCLGPTTVHEVIAVSNCRSAADGLNTGLKRAKHEWVVCVHQDVYLPSGWVGCLAQQLG